MAINVFVAAIWTGLYAAAAQRGIFVVDGMKSIPVEDVIVWKLTIYKYFVANFHANKSIFQYEPWAFSKT